jgi:Na+/H+ antiporter NhaC
MFSCVFQGIIPYGAQLLSAATLAGISPFQIMRYLYYPYLMGISALIAILFIPNIKKK